MTGVSPADRRLPEVDALVVKPFELADLLEAIRPFLRNGHQTGDQDS